MNSSALHKLLFQTLFFSACLILFSSQLVTAQEVQCCNVKTGQWSKTDSASACEALPDHIPYSPANSMKVMACFVNTTQQAQQIQSGILGSTGMPGMPGSTSTEPDPNCCQTGSASWLGAMPADACLAETGQFPDTPAYLNETQICRPSSGNGAWSRDDFEDNIPNGDMELWRDPNAPDGFTSFGIPASARQAAQGFDMQTVFKSDDAYTGKASARLKNFDMTEAVRKLGSPVVIDLSSSNVGGGLNSCQNDCALKSGKPGSGSIAETTLPIEQAKPYFCGAYKGFISPQDQLNITAALVNGDQVIGGTDSGVSGASNFTESSADWFTFALPINVKSEDLNGASGITISAQVQPRNLLGGIQAGGLPAAVSGVSQVNVDSFHFCEPYNLKAFHPHVVTYGEDKVIPDDEEETKGVQTFVNLDNDDQDGAFDFKNTKPVSGENEMVRFQASLPINVRGTAQIKISGVGETVALWADATKSAPFDLANAEMPVTDLLQPNSNQTQLIRNFWIEGIAPSKTPQDIQIDFIFVNAAADGDDYTDKITMTVLGIEDITWVGRGNSVGDTDILDPDPNWPDGQSQEAFRVFPGKRFRGAPEDAPRNIVDAKVTLNVKPVRPIPFYFRVFDVDDPTAHDNKVDDESSAWDNRGTDPGQMGKFEEAAQDILFMEIDETETKIGFQVTMQPGDNFRMAGSGDKEALKALENDDSALFAANPKLTALIVDKAVFQQTQDPIKAQMRKQNQYVSDVLTVWRKLHLEVDSMDKVTDAEVKGTVTTVEEIGMEGKSTTYRLGLGLNLYAQLPAESQSGLQGWEDNYAKGEIFINGAGYQVLRSTANVRPQEDFLVIRRGPSRPVVPKDLVNREFALFDDDLLRDGGTLYPLRTEKIAPSFEPAYILPIENEIPNATPIVPFRLHFKSDDQAYLKSVFAEGFDNKAYHDDPDFWVVYLLNAYQGSLSEDGDGNDGNSGLSGQADSNPGPPGASPVGRDGYGAAVFMESGLETAIGYSENNTGTGWQLQDVAPHEIGHLFGAKHSDNGLMGYDAEKTEDFEPITLDRMREWPNP